ncbi:MAG: radical SAM protein [archaeon]|nr:radical SAM protein [archaeon]
MNQHTFNNISKLSNPNDDDCAYAKTILSDVKYLKLKAPLFVQFELTGGCNQKCIFCYNVWKESDSNLSTPSKKEQINILNKIISNEVFSIIFSGGEPLLIKWLEDLIYRASNKNIETSLITNAILLTRKRAMTLRESGLNSIQISLHHYSESINDFLVNEKAFKKTLKGIQNALEVFGDNAVNVNMVVLPSTVNDVYKMAEYMSSIGLKHFSIGMPTATGEMSKNKSLVINKEDFMKVFHQLVKAKSDFQINTSFTGGFPLCILPEINEDIIGMINNYCDAGLNQLVIEPNGVIRPCVCLSKNIGNILDDNMKTIWEQDEYLNNLRKLSFIPEVCKNCKYAHICRGGCRASAYSYYGEINAIDPLMS